MSSVHIEKVDNRYLWTMRIIHNGLLTETKEWTYTAYKTCSKIAYLIYIKNNPRELFTLCPLAEADYNQWEQSAPRVIEAFKLMGRPR